MDQAIVFGQYDHLMGVANFPDIEELNSRSGDNLSVTRNEQKPKVAMILLTAGMLHSVGPYRMYVDIANNLAKQGIPSFRFDLSGIGESFGVGTTGKSSDRATLEAKEAMDYLSNKHGIEEFVFFGLCSGADDSIQVALQDKRVKGVIALDGLGYSTPRSKLMEKLLFGKKLLRLSKWQNKIKNKMDNKQAPVSLATGSDVREFPDTREQASDELQKLTDRNTQLHFIYTGGTDYYHYAEQFYDMLPAVNWKGNESVIYYPHMDHVVMLCEDRKQLVDSVVDKTLKMAVT